MKTTVRQLMNVLLVGLLLTAIIQTSKANDPKAGDPAATQRSFDISLYMGAERKVNLRMAIRRPERITITVKDANNTVRYRESINKGPSGYWRQFIFDDAEPGVYQFGIRNGQQSIVRRIEVVDVPAIDAQRYITYDLKASL